MKRLCFFTLVTLLVCTGAAYGQSAGSGGGSFVNAFLVPEIVCSAGSFGTSINPACPSSSGLLFGNIKVPSASNKNVLVMASLETSLLTDTQVASQNGNKSTATASGSIAVTPKVFQCPGNDCSGSSGPLVDITTLGGTVTPSMVTFNSRVQTLSANLLGLGCSLNSSGVVICTSPETIDLILSTTSAHAFNFLVQTPGAGVYQVQLGLGVTTSATSDSLLSGAQVKIGVGAGSLVEMIVQAQTPFDTIKLCGTGNSGGGGGAGTNSCGP